MELTYEQYVAYGGMVSLTEFPRMKAEAENDLAMLGQRFDIVWNSDESRVLALCSLIDAASVAQQTLQSGGGVTSVKVGSYSETRGGGGGGVFGSAGNASAILRKYARLYRKPVGVIR